MLFTAYYDESGVHQGSPCTVLAGLVGNVEAWARFEWAWAQVLRKNQITHLRAKHLYHRQGQHKGWSEKQEDTLWNDLLYVFQEHKDIMISKTILLEEDYLRTYRSDPLPKERLDSRYALCLRSCLSLFAAQHYSMNPLGSVNFVLEQGHKNAGDALRVFDEFKKQDQRWGQALGELSFGEKRQIPALQAADLIAYWAYVTERDVLSGNLDPWESSYIEDLLVQLDYTVARHLITPLDLAKLRQNFLAKKKKRRALQDAVVRINTSELVYYDRYHGFPIDLYVSADEVAALPSKYAVISKQRRRALA